jgi:hypothetical protein
MSRFPTDQARDTAMKRYFLSSFAFSFAVLLLGSQTMGQPPPPKEVIVEGVVYNPRTEKGIPALTVQLIPPRSVKSPKRVLQTDRDGNFRFQDRDPQKYLGKNLLEVRDGPRLLFRKEIDTSRAEFRRVKIPIR